MRFEYIITEAGSFIPAIVFCITGKIIISKIISKIVSKIISKMEMLSAQQINRVFHIKKWINIVK